MKKNLTALLTLAMTLALLLTACGSGTGSGSQEPAQSDNVQTDPAELDEHEHSWEGGVCALCGEMCEHEWENGRCAVCRLRCAHERHDEETLVCDACGRPVQHGYVYTDYVDGVCSMCGKTTNFVWEVGGVDETLKAECANQGTIETVTYTTHAYAAEAASGREDITLEKTMYVYLPYGYSEEKNYNVLYLMHGGGENEGYWFGMGDYYPEWFEKYQATNCVVNILDNMIDKDVIDPLIVVAVSFYSNVDGMGDYSMSLPAHFYKEFKGEIMPLIAEKYSTYAEGTAQEALIAARDHVGYAGFSMGSMTGFQSIMENSLDYVGWIGNYSAGYNPGETTESYADALNGLIEKLKGEYKDYAINYWFNGDGKMDQAHDGHVETYEVMLRELPERFTDGDNCIFVDLPSGGHTYPAWEVDLYNSLIVFFK